MVKKIVLVFIAACCSIAFLQAVADDGQSIEQQGYILSASPLHVVSPTEDHYRQGLADEDGNIVLPAQYVIFDTPLSYIVIISSKNGKRGFVDKASGFYMPPQFDSVLDYDCTEADAPIFVGLDGRYWYIWRFNGAEAYPGRYYNAENEYCEFYQGYALTSMNIAEDGEYEYEFALMDIHSNYVTYPDGIMAFSGNQDGLVRIHKSDENNLDNSYFGIGDLNGKIIVEPVYDWIEDFCNGYASMLKDGKWGHIDMQGNVVLPPTYELEMEETIYGYFFDEDGLATFTLADGSELTIRTDGSVYK